MILVTGATGYVGGRLVPRLLERGYQVRACGRSLAKLESRPWASHPGVQLAACDLLKPDEIRHAAAGCRAAYYLVHSMVPGEQDFSSAEKTAAANMVAAAESQGLERILYLGGLGSDASDLSRHLRSRSEVAAILQSGKVPVTALRAAMIIGSGSASFEILRYLVDRLPVMVTPRWVQTPNQPIAVRNVLEYLIGCLEHPETAGQVYDIGGPDVLTYRELMRIYAEEARLPRRWIVPVPVLTPRLSSYWIHLVTPVPASIARPLAEGLKNPVVCSEHRIRDLIPQPLLSCREAIRRALESMQADHIETHWTDAGRLPPVELSYEGDPVWAGGTLFKDCRSAGTAASRETLWDCISRIGGRHGWYHADRLWVLRGFLDRMIGGVGLRRGRRAGAEIHAGDALDFWRVLSVCPGRHLLLAAEMKLPGAATLEFRIEESPEGKRRLVQTASFKPRGLMGILYWYLVSPLHGYVFSGMLRKILRAAESPAGEKK